LEVRKNENIITFLIRTEADPQLEIWGAQRKSYLFEKITGRTLEIHPQKNGEVVTVEQPNPFPEHKS